MMDDHDLNSDPAAAMVTAMEELWQNQTYIPIKGWGAPFTGPDHYTDVTGEKSLSNWDFPDLSPLPGSIPLLWCANLFMNNYFGLRLEMDNKMDS